MLAVFYGSDRQQVRDAATNYIDQNIPPDGTVTSLDATGYQLGQLADALGATSLFGGVEWFVLDTPSSNEEFNDEVTGALAELDASPNVFVVLEGALLAAPKKAYAKHATEVAEFKADAAERFNAFSMADALAAKDKRRLWVLLQEARLAGLRPEEIVGTLWWQLKALRLAAQTRTAAEAGLKDFPYNKAKRALNMFKDGEVESLSQSLLQCYHDGHAGQREIDLALEHWVLTL